MLDVLVFEVWLIEVVRGGRFFDMETLSFIG